MNHRLIIGALAALPLFAAALPAQAADMAVPYKAPPPPPPAFSWSGFYIGAHVGAGWGSREFDYNDLTPAAPFLWDSSVPVNGPLAGGQIGANWQVGWAVLGVEADGSWANLTGKGICNSTVFFLNCSAKTDGLATVTGRLGADFDRTLVYIKGGGAWMHESSTISNVALPPIASGFSSSISNDRTGWTLGLGLEYAFAMHWSAKLEYDFMDFGTKRYNFPATNALIPANTFTNWDLVDRLHTVKAGVNYHF
jgi:outer membrane immunogenic protein